jgi:hypothetical protein
VVRDLIVVVTAYYCVHHINVASEHLVEMSTLTMGLSTASDCRCKVTV